MEVHGGFAGMLFEAHRDDGFVRVAVFGQADAGAIFPGVGVDQALGWNELAEDAALPDFYWRVGAGAVAAHADAPAIAGLLAEFHVKGWHCLGPDHCMAMAGSVQARQTSSRGA